MALRGRDDYGGEIPSFCPSECKRVELAAAGNEADSAILALDGGHTGCERQVTEHVLRDEQIVMNRTNFTNGAELTSENTK